MTQTNQNIPQGYKKTQIGIIPDDWEVKKFENIAQKNGLIRGPFGGTLKKEIFVKKGFKVYQQQNAIYKNPKIGNYFIDEAKYKELSRFSLEKNDFIVSCSGTIGKIYKIPKDFQRGVINQALLLIRLNSSKINFDFFYSIFESDLIQKRILESQGGAMKNLVGMSQIRKLKLPIPPLKEQEEIANCLTAWDKAITQSKKLIEAKKQVKKGLMQQLLTGKKRLDGFTDEWKEVKLGEILKERNENKKSHLRVITSSRKGLYYQEDYFKKIVASKSLDNYKLLKMGDFTFRSMSDDGYFFFNRMNFDKPGIVSPAYSVFYCTNVIPNFFYYFINNNHFNKYLQGIVQGGTRLALKFNALKKLKVTLPTIEEQTAIAEILQAADKEIELLEQKLKALELQKKGLMQVLLTGKKRLV